MQGSISTQFEEDCHEVSDELRGALICLFDSVSADPMVPQDVSRRFKINRNLAWKIARILKANGSLEAFRHIPGADGMEIMLKKMDAAGADPESIKNIRDAMLAFDKMVEVHVGDRATLELVLDSMAPRSSDQLETSRKLAFRGNSGIWGIQAKTRLTTVMMAPNPDEPSLIDSVQLMGYFGFRRFRSAVCCPLLMPHSWSVVDGTPTKVELAREALDPDATDTDGLHLMEEFCSGDLPQIASVNSGMAQRYRLARGPIGNLGAFDLVAGDVMRRHVPRYADASNHTGEQSTSIVAPIENLVFDMIVHRDLAFALDPTVLTYGKEWEPGCAPEELEDIALPMNDEVSRLSGSPPVVTTPLVPRYSEMIDRVWERMAWNPKDFRGIRLHMKYPPLDSTVMLRFPLPMRG